MGREGEGMKSYVIMGQKYPDLIINKTTTYKEYSQ